MTFFICNFHLSSETHLEPPSYKKEIHWKKKNNLEAGETQGQAFMCVILMALQKCTLGISFFEAKQFVPCMYLEMFFLFPPPQLVNAAVKLAILEQVFFFFFLWL